MSEIRTTGKKSSNTLVRDLINVGIFAALYLVLGAISASVGFIPAFIVVSTCCVALVTSVPMFLFYSKIERPVLCCTLLSGFFGAFMMLTGHGISLGAICVVCGILMGAGLKFFGKNFAGFLSANVVLSLVPSSMMLPLWFSTEEYLEYTKMACDDAYVAHLAELAKSPWPLIALYVFGVLGAIVGAFVARRVMKKHFERIGLAK